MRKQYALITTALLISLFIYLFYRTEKTLVNQLLVWLISVEAYTHIKAVVVNTLPLNNVVVYSLPEGLWIFCITLTSKTYHFIIFGRRFNCLYMPLLFCLSLEILQMTHVTNGRFDWMDIGMSILFWLPGCYGFNPKEEKQHIFTSLNSKTLVCFISYGIVYLAHVFK
ncbi:hypothetical protein [Mucilaginibacter terrae]|uniref:VanZ family protein n=1 Tax=Mucilaginibacter terrae TaxID=1955052 RepID=A0ABU3GRG9_9SPHI|nr:hypothetical protein [Mucilaginibacter terrae]MDT3402361.1 hypothetical protein [Mucilaginibacter terrae]